MNEKLNTHCLSAIINDEMATNIVLDTPLTDNVFRIFKAKMGLSLESDTDDEFAMALFNDERHYFTQGFIRGIAAAKGGAV